jgi:hypothetical protein
LGGSWRRRRLERGRVGRRRSGIRTCSSLESGRIYEDFDDDDGGVGDDFF